MNPNITLEQLNRMKRQAELNIEKVLDGLVEQTGATLSVKIGLQGGTPLRQETSYSVDIKVQL